jgi:hypothetical protein
MAMTPELAAVKAAEQQAALRQRGLITAEGLNRGLDALAKPAGTDASSALPTVHQAALAGAHQTTSTTDATDLYL